MLEPPRFLRLNALPTQSLPGNSIRDGLVSRILQAQNTPTQPLRSLPNSIYPNKPGNSPSLQSDKFSLVHPDQLRGKQTAPISGAIINFQSPSQQLHSLGQKYGVPYQGEKMSSYQKKVIKTILTHKAREHGIPVNIALGIAGNESGWSMWQDIDQGKVIQGKNIRDGVLKSTDWGVMQINDKAHYKPTVFPRVTQDLEYNIDYGLSYLARQRKKGIQGDLGHGFGSWDRTIASYNLGHNPKTERALEIASHYVPRVHKRSMMA